MSLPVAKLELCIWMHLVVHGFSQLFKRVGIAANAAAGDGKNDLQCDYGGVLSSKSYYTLEILQMLLVGTGCQASDSARKAKAKNKHWQTLDSLSTGHTKGKGVVPANICGEHLMGSVFGKPSPVSTGAWPVVSSRKA